MKRFSKILTLFLALVVIVTAFTVVALADDSASEPMRYYVGDGALDLTFEGGTVGELSISGLHAANQTLTTSDFVYVTEAYPGGNKYLTFLGNQSNECPKVFCYVSTDNAVRSQYGFDKTPIMSLDFDIMLVNGKWGYVDKNVNSSGVYFRTHYLSESGSWKNPTDDIGRISFNKMGLSSQKYLWQHVTVISEYYEQYNEETEATTQYLKFRSFLNGVETNETFTINLNTKFSSLSAEEILSFFIPQTYFASTRFYHDTSAHQPYGEEFAIDNIEYAFYEEGYDIESIPTIIYNDEWEAPFSQIAATVTVEDEGGNKTTSYFDDVNKAIEFAKENNAVVSLEKNASVAFNVDSEITIDANIYDEDGNSTGKYTFVTPITTKGYCIEETFEGSGIYTSKLGGFAVISNGVMAAYPADQFDTVFANVEAGSTIKLLTSIETSAAFKLNSNHNNVVLDLNGFNLTRISYSGNVYQATYNEETQEYVCDTTGTPTAITATSATFFTWNAASVTFTITSSVPGSSIANMTANADIWEYEGKIVKRVINSSSYITSTSYNMFNITKNYSVLNLSNISVYYGGYLIHQSNGSAGNHTINIDNVNCYSMATSGYILYSNHKTNLALNVSNSLLYYPAGVNSYIYRFVNATTTPASQKTTVRFSNTDIISTKTSYSIRTTVATGVNLDQIFDNCRFYNANCSSWIANNGSLAYYTTKSSSESYAPTAADGYEKLDTSVKIEYYYPLNTIDTTTNGLIETPSVAPATSTITLTYNKLITKAVDVNFVDESGEIVDTVQLTPGVDTIGDNIPTLKKILENNPYLNVVYQWADANGIKVSADAVLGLTNKGVVWPAGLTDEDGNVTYAYNFYAKESIGGVANYVGGIKDVQFNLVFLTGFRYNLYLPVTDDLTDVAVEGYTKGNATVFIYGKEYTVWYATVGSAAAAEANTITATYKVDGTEYSQSWTINAVDYAQRLIAAPAFDSEKETAVKMIKFIKEAVLRTEGSTVDTDALDDIVTGAGFDTAYGTYTEGNADCLAPFGGAVTGAQFVVYNGVAAYKFTLAAEDTEISFRVNGEDIGFTREGNTVILDPMRVYDIIDPISVTAGGVTAKVSMLDYLTAKGDADDMELAKALYEFGIAADDYKKDIMENGNFAN